MSIEIDSIRDAAEKTLKRTLSDQLIVAISRSLTLTNIGTSYADIFPALYSGFPIPIDTKGFSKLGIILLWNKSGGTGRHDLRIVNNADTNQVMVATDQAPTNMPTGLPSGLSESFDIDIPANFIDFRGKVRIQAKSTVATDDPVFDGLLLYLIRD